MWMEINKANIQRSIELILIAQSEIIGALENWASPKLYIKLCSKLNYAHIVKWAQGGTRGGEKVRHWEQGECKTAFIYCQTPNDDSGLMTLRPVTPSHYSATVPLCHNLHAVIWTDTLGNYKAVHIVIHHNSNFLTAQSFWNFVKLTLYQRGVHSTWSFLELQSVVQTALWFFYVTRWKNN